MDLAFSLKEMKVCIVCIVFQDNLKYQLFSSVNKKYSRQKRGSLHYTFKRFLNNLIPLKTFYIKPEIS